LVLESFAADEDGRHGFYVHLAPAMRKWLVVKGAHYTSKIEEAMRDAYYHIWPSDKTARKLFDREFRVVISDSGLLRLSIPSHGSGLDPESKEGDKKTSGYRLVPHNIEVIQQQLALLAGVAKLHDLARARP
jgi:hypothetical protein